MSRAALTLGSLAIALAGCDLIVKGDDFVEPGCVATGGPAPDEDYLYKPENWACLDNAVDTTLWIDSIAFQNALTTLGLDPDRTRAAGQLDSAVVQPSFSEWSSAADIQWTRTFSVVTAYPSDNGLSEISAHPASSGVFASDPDALALTWSREHDPSHPTQITECDTWFFAQSVDKTGTAYDVEWVLEDDPAVQFETVLKRVFTHELGHCLGLGDQTDPGLRESVMWETVDPDDDGPIDDVDIDAVVWLYGP